MTFTGPLICLDPKSSFDHILGLNLIVIQIIPHSKQQCATNDINYLASKIPAFCNLCRLHIFFISVQLKYAGTTSYDSYKMLADISLALSNLKMVYNHRRRMISLTPDDLFSRYTEFLPLLSPNTLIWSFILVTLFFPCFYSRVAGSSATRGIYFTCSFAFIYLPFAGTGVTNFA